MGDKKTGIGSNQKNILNSLEVVVANDSLFLLAKETLVFNKHTQDLQ